MIYVRSLVKMEKVEISLRQFHRKNRLTQMNSSNGNLQRVREVKLLIILKNCSNNLKFSSIMEIHGKSK